MTMTSKTSSYDLEAAGPPCTGKVIQLRRRGAPRSAGVEAPGTSSSLLDLQVPIDNLRSIKCDLELYHWERPAAHRDQQDRERYQVGIWIRQVSDRTATLEAIQLHMGTSTIVLPPAGAVELEALRSATALLGCWIRDDAPFEQVLPTVAAILNAADVIGLAAAGGRPEPRVRRPPSN